MGEGKAALLGGMMAAWALATATPAWADRGDERKLRQSCDRGERSACIALGKLLAEPYTLHEDRPRALALLRPVCDNPATLDETAEICAIVGDLILVQSTLDPSSTDAAQIDAYLARACDAGSRATCGTLVTELESGELIAADATRARWLRERLCRAGEQESCEALAPPREQEPTPIAAAGAVEAGDTIGQGREIAFADLPPLTPEGFPGSPAEEAAPDTNAAQGAPEEQADVSEELVEVDASQSAPRIVRVNRGKKVTPGYANWVAIIWRPGQVGSRELEPSERVACGGSLIAPGWVLTAAHCLDDGAGRVSPGSNHTIRLGTFNPLNLDEGNTYRILQVIGHRGYNPKTSAWDIALIQFDVARPKRGKVWGKIQPVSVDARPAGTRPISADLPVNVLGWGRTSPDNPRPSDALRRGTVSLLSEAACTEATLFKDTTRKDSLLCAAARTGQHNCQGDSGGPLVLEDGRRNRKVLLGVISSADTCGDGKKPSRFIRVTQRAVWAWLQTNLPRDAWRRMTLAVE